jgi:hypothetical protein
MTQEGIYIRDPEFIAYHWESFQSTELQAVEHALAIAHGATAEDRLRSFLTLLRSKDVAAQGIAMDNYSYNQTLQRWGCENEFQPYESEILATARQQLQCPPVTPDSDPEGYTVGANHASALCVLRYLGTEADCNEVASILRTSQETYVLYLACEALGTCWEGSQIVCPDILKVLRHLIFDVDLSDSSILRVSIAAIDSLSGYQVAGAESILMEALRHENHEISAQAALVLVRWDLPQYYEQIQKFMQNWPESDNFTVFAVQQEIDEYLNPPQPVLSEEEERELHEAERKRNVERIKKAELAKYYPDGCNSYFWDFTRDLLLPDREIGNAYLRAAEVLISSDEAICLEKFHQLLSSDFIPAKCVAFDIFAFHQALRHYNFKNPFLNFSDEILAQARLQLKKEPVTSSKVFPIVGANYGSAFLALKYLGDSSDLAAIEPIIQESQDTNVLLHGWQAIRHCSGQLDILYPEIFHNTEKLLSNSTISISNSQAIRDVLELFRDCKADEAERILLGIVQGLYSAAYYVETEAALILLQHNLPKYIDIVRETIEYFVEEGSRLFSVEESYRIIQEYDQKHSAESARVGLGLQ